MCFTDTQPKTTYKEQAMQKRKGHNVKEPLMTFTLIFLNDFVYIVHKKQLPMTTEMTVRVSYPLRKVIMQKLLHFILVLSTD